MQVILNIDSTLAALSAVSGVIPARSPRAVLQNFALEIDPDGENSILATDLEIGARVRCIGVKADGKARLLLPPDRVRQILQLAKPRNAELTLEVRGDGDSPSIRITGVGVRYDLPLEDAKLYPDVPDFTAADYDVVEAQDLLRGVRRTIPFTDIESTRFSLGGVLFEFGDDGLTMVATDGRRLSTQSMSTNVVGKGSSRTKAEVVPVKALKLLAKLCANGDPPIHVAVTDKAAMFRTESSSVFTRLVEGRFPRWTDVFAGTEGITTKATFTAGSFLNAVKSASVTTGEESRGVDCKFGDGRVVMNASAADRGASEIEAELAWVGPPVEITFDGRYLVEAMEAMEPDAELTMAVADKLAAVLTSGDSYRGCIMPLTRDR